MKSALAAKNEEIKSVNQQLEEYKQCNQKMSLDLTKLIEEI